MHNPTNPPVSATTLPGLLDYPTPAFKATDELPEYSWTTLVMSILACVVVMLCAAGAYAGAL